MNTGDLIVKAMSKLTLNEWKYSLLTCFDEYKKLIYDDEGKSDPWMHFLDLVALQWGFYGDLDLNIDQMEEKLATTLHNINTREEADVFIKSVGDFKDEHDKQIADMGDEWTIIK